MQLKKENKRGAKEKKKEGKNIKIIIKKKIKIAVTIRHEK